MPKNCDLAQKKQLHISDLKGLPVIISRASEPYLTGSGILSGLHVSGTYNLIFNASLMVEDGLGYALCFDRLINTTGDSPLTFRPLIPQLRVAGTIIWKKYQMFSPAVQMFIDKMREVGCNKTN